MGFALRTPTYSNLKPSFTNVVMGKKVADLLLEYDLDLNKFYQNPPQEEHPLLRQIKGEFLLEACFDDNLVEVKKLLEQGISPNDSPVPIIHFTSNIEILKLLIKSGCDLKSVYNNIPPSGHELIKQAHGELVMDALLKKDLKEIGKLLFQGIDTSSQEEDKNKIFKLIQNRLASGQSNSNISSKLNDAKIASEMLRLMMDYKLDVSQFYKDPPNEDHPLLKQIKDEQEPKISKNKRLKFPKIPKSIRVVFSNVTSISPPSFTSYFLQTRAKSTQKDIVSGSATENQASVNDTRSNPPKTTSILVENVSSAEPIKPSVYSRIKAGIFGKRTNSTFNR